MKKILISVLLVSLAFAAFADDAKVLPEGVLRATFANIMVTSDKAFDADGEEQDSMEKFFDYFGAALEFGVTDTITAAIQWTPGFVIAGDLDYPGYDDQDWSGLADLFLGAKIQILNDSMMRFAFAPGLIAPIDKLVYDDEMEKYTDGDAYRMKSQSTTESIGIGLRLYFDYIVTEEFYVNLYNQTKYYFPNKVENLYGGEDDMEYGIYLDFELEPHYDLTLNKTASMGFGLPVKYNITGETTTNDTADDNESNLLSINPGVSFFYSGGFPFEIAANYEVPLMGKSTDKKSIFTVKLKLFYDFY